MDDFCRARRIHSARSKSLIAETERVNANYSLAWTWLSNCACSGFGNIYAQMPASAPSTPGHHAVSPATTHPLALVVTELYPPDVGGSAVLFGEVYSRVPGPVRVLTEARGRADERRGDVDILRRSIATMRWGFVDPRATLHHLRSAARLRRLGGGTGTVVHCGRGLPEGVAALVNRRLGGAPYLCWAHGEDIASAATSRELRLLLGQVYAGASSLVANSRNTANMLAAVGVPPHRIVTVYPGVDADRFTPHSGDFAGVRGRYVGAGGTMLLSVGRLQRRKGHDLAIQAVAQLAAGEPRLRYLIVGDGEERGRLEELARDCGVAEHVIFAGEVSAEALPGYFAACDIFLLPNRIENGDVEGFGIVFLEAASAARAVIAGNTGGVPEAVAAGHTGLLVSGTDVEELATTIRRLLGDVVLRTRLGKAGRDRVLKSFTWQRAADLVWESHHKVALERAGM